jgi:hypothetical protein
VIAWHLLTTGEPYRDLGGCGVCVRGIRARCLMHQLGAALVARGPTSRVIDAGV